MEPYQAVFKRKEVKYLLTEAQLFALRLALEAHMEPDDFAHSSIYNLYYDTPDFRLIRRSLEKPAYKEKLRLRSYGVPDEETQVFPEIKKKARGIVYKRRVCMPYGDALRYLSRRQPCGDGRSFRSSTGCSPLTAALRRASSSAMSGIHGREGETPLCA